jgi:TusA-related sulfurtransferase
MPLIVHSEKPAWDYSYEFDGGHKSCGELILDLKLFIQDLPSGARILVIAHDLGAWIDIPAWCLMTEQPLLAEAHPYYLIQRR